MSDTMSFPPGQGETLDRMAKAKNYNRWLIDRSRPYLGASIIDVGAGVGTFTQVASSVAERVVALEPDPEFAPALERRFSDSANVEVMSAEIQDVSFRSEFDAIICFNVLEHIRDDDAALERLHDVLRPGGHLLLLVPAHPVLMGEIDRTVGHERRYRRESLDRLLRSSGFEVVELRHVNPVGALGWLVWSRTLRKEQIPERPLRAFDGMVRSLRLLDRLRLPFGLSLWSVARRQAA